jgi:hypothetical protein
MSNKMFYISPRTGEEIINAEDVMSRSDEPITQVGTEKACSP